MTAAELILSLGLAVSQPLADAIDRHCDDVACRADAVATCYVETRCQLGHCGSNGCGPFQQLGRYADDIPELVELTIPERRELLNTCPDTAMRQYLAVMTRYRSRYGDRWPRRYNGSARADAYLEHWWTIRRRLARFKNGGE